ncbi:PREDICTED: alpha-mannosidase I MNS5-like isoform X1 [Camelina sativa]|uniref:Alpha-mannosidase I MNS5-like isoform X1 n=1 Tax=Camelina sativa TaxID=90675 RepID=A0ABM0VSK6_CAMSA|nr:PREDICTED: alpha-mannosidase I MNS5-like isoform X1 [Camelina sativa]
MQLEDHQHSFFLAETCKYLYLLFGDSFVAKRNYIFTTEGHPIQVVSSWHEKLPKSYFSGNWTLSKELANLQRGAWESGASALSLQVCPSIALNSRRPEQHRESACHVPDEKINHRCWSNKECGVDATTCRQRSCSEVGYCGLWNPL